MLTITDINYEQYKKVFVVLYGFFQEELLKQLPASSHEALLNADAVAMLVRWEARNMEQAKKGLKIGLMDSINSLTDASDEQKKEIDRRLKENNLPGLYALLSNAWDILDKVLEKKKIRTIDEYYAIVEQVSRVDAPFNDEQRQILNEAILAFEQKSKPRKS